MLFLTTRREKYDTYFRTFTLWFADEAQHAENPAATENLVQVDDVSRLGKAEEDINGAASLHRETPLENDLPPPPPTAVVVPDHRASRARELQAREREFAEGQQQNMINGVWHCSNCGCPETIAVGRRKGPLGDKSQCGTCGRCFIPDDGRPFNSFYRQVLAQVPQAAPN
jgi:hypothetical protein